MAQIVLANRPLSLKSSICVRRFLKYYLVISNSTLSFESLVSDGDANMPYQHPQLVR